MNLARGWRGGERQTLLLLQGLRHAGDDARLLARPGSVLAQRASAAGVPVHGSRLALLACRGRGFDVVHAHEARGLQWAALLRACGGPPLVATRRIDTPPRETRFSHWKYRRADRVIAISDYVRRVMAAWGVDEQRLGVIPSAVPAQATEPDPDRVAALRATLKGRFVIGFVGALVDKHKDPQTLLRAFERLNTQHRDLALLIVGDGPDRPAFQAYIAEHAIADVHMTGFVDDPETYYACMDLFVLPSRTEGLGTAALDAFAWGLPVIAGRAGALPEIVRDGETGLLFEPGDDAALARAIDWIRAHPDAADALATAGTRLLHERHSPAAMVAAYRLLYTDISA